LESFLIDIAIIGIVAYCAWRGFRNGLIRGAFGIVALVVSLIVANVAAEAFSDDFEGILVPFVGGVVDTALNEVELDNIDFDALEDHEDDSYEFLSAFAALREIGLPVPAAIRIAERAVADDESDDTPAYIIAAELSSTLAYIAVFAVAFVLVAIVFAVVGNLIGFVFSLPGLRLLDGILGTAFGLIKGLIVVLALALFARYFGLLAIEIIEETTVLNHLINNNAIADMLGL